MEKKAHKKGHITAPLQPNLNLYSKKKSYCFKRKVFIIVSFSMKFNNH
jgi:hypothetical protein